LRESLKKMLVLLEGERTALSSFNMEHILTCADGKLELCAQIEQNAARGVDEECHGLLDAAHRLNEINRKLRNLIAANVQARLGALTGSISLYGGARAPMREVTA
jgi:hypothetical protein